MYICTINVAGYGVSPSTTVQFLISESRISVRQEDIHVYMYCIFTYILGSQSWWLSLDQICRFLLCCNLEDTHLYGTQGTSSAASVSHHNLFSLDLSSFRFCDFSLWLLSRLCCYCTLVFSPLGGHLHCFHIGSGWDPLCSIQLCLSITL